MRYSQLGGKALGLLAFAQIDFFAHQPRGQPHQLVFWTRFLTPLRPTLRYQELRLRFLLP
jgi:hypothetical protein